MTPPPRGWVTAVYTLGCKLNQLESESITDAFHREGFAVMPWNEDEGIGKASGCRSILIINTCTVTSKSEQKARRIIRKALNDFPEALVIVTGCYAQMEAEALEALSIDKGLFPTLKRLFVIPGALKNEILDLPRILNKACTDRGVLTLHGFSDLIASWAAAVGTQEGGSSLRSRQGFSANEASFCFNPWKFSFHSRAFMKIQDGCDNSCSFCRTRLARGKSRSLEAKEALALLCSLEERGYQEAVLTGVNISQYAGTAEVQNLSGLLEYFLSGTRRIRLRLSSIEPEVFRPGFIRAVSHPRICPHFHFSLQSASRIILKRMNRLYNPKEAEEGIALLRSARGDPFLACDIIAGFPGETQEEFEKTFDFCERLQFTGIHVFPFSPRPGTAAWDFKDRVTEKEARLRARKLKELAFKNRRSYIERWLGRETEAVVEDIRERKRNGYLEDSVPAVSANYLKLLVSFKDGKQPKPGSLIRCKILEAIETENQAREMPRYDAIAVLL